MFESVDLPPSLGAGAAGVAVRAGTVYLLGAHAGPDSHWIARVDAAQVQTASPARVDTGFRLHRAVNDALRAAGVDLAQLPEDERIGGLIAAGEAEGAPWRRYLRYADSPLELGGAAFGPDGRLLLGLRSPVTAAGHALVVAVADADAVLDAPDAVPEHGSVWTLAGPEGGIDAMAPHGDGLQVRAGDGEHHRYGPLPEDGGVVRPV